MRQRLDRTLSSAAYTDLLPQSDPRVDNAVRKLPREGGLGQFHLFLVEHIFERLPVRASAAAHITSAARRSKTSTLSKACGIKEHLVVADALHGKSNAFDVVSS